MCACVCLSVCLYACVSDVVLLCYCGLLPLAKKLCSRCYTVSIVAFFRSCTQYPHNTHARQRARRLAVHGRPAGPPKSCLTFAKTIRLWIFTLSKAACVAAALGRHTCAPQVVSKFFKLFNVIEWKHPTNLHLLRFCGRITAVSHSHTTVYVTIKEKTQKKQQRPNYCVIFIFYSLYSRYCSINVTWK